LRALARLGSGKSIQSPSNTQVQQDFENRFDLSTIVHFYSSKTRVIFGIELRHFKLSVSRPHNNGEFELGGALPKIKASTLIDHEAMNPLDLLSEAFLLPFTPHPEFPVTSPPDFSPPSLSV
jgi:hypothetical protein